MTLHLQRPWQACSLALAAALTLASCGPPNARAGLSAASAETMPLHEIESREPPVVLPVGSVERAKFCLAAAIWTADHRAGEDRQASWLADKAREVQFGTIAAGAIGWKADAMPYFEQMGVQDNAREYLDANPQPQAYWTGAASACGDAYPQTRDDAPVSLPTSPSDALVACSSLAYNFSGERSGSDEEDKAALASYTTFFQTTEQHLFRILADENRVRRVPGEDTSVTIDRYLQQKAAQLVVDARPDRALAACMAASGSGSASKG